MRDVDSDELPLDGGVCEKSVDASAQALALLQSACAADHAQSPVQSARSMNAAAWSASSSVHSVSPAVSAAPLNPTGRLSTARYTADDGAVPLCVAIETSSVQLGGVSPRETISRGPR